MPPSVCLLGGVTLNAGTFTVLPGMTHKSRTYVNVSLVPENALAMDRQDSAFNRFLPNVLLGGWAAVPSHKQILTSGFHSSANAKEKEMWHLMSMSIALTGNEAEPPLHLFFLIYQQVHYWLFYVCFNYQCWERRPGPCA